MAALDPQAHIAMLEGELQWANLTIEKRDAQIRLLEERLRQQRIQALGPRSETLSDLQLELLAEQEPSATRDEVEAEARRAPLPPPRERKPHPGRKRLPENLPRLEQVIACPDANCKSCGAETSLHDLEYDQPAGFARFILEVEDPDGAEDKVDVEALERIVGCMLRRVVARY